mmetsp:Transcript_60245/g.160299  ORF Transcript_60245/g.160299 Transcript_60245/m.160299 type:complete len:373 (-) Transcript_60245:1141-2259(-)
MGCGSGVLARGDEVCEDKSAQRRPADQRNQAEEVANVLIESMTRGSSASKRLRNDVEDLQPRRKGTWTTPSSLLASANDECRRAIAEHLVPHTVRCGEVRIFFFKLSSSSFDIHTLQVLFFEGSQGSSLYFVNSGSVAVNIRNQQVATLSPGDFFGELGLMFGQGRTATIVGLSDESELLELSKESFNEVLDRFPKFADDINKKLSATCSARLRSEDMIPMGSSPPGGLPARLPSWSQGPQQGSAGALTPTSSMSSDAAPYNPARPSSAATAASPEPQGPRWLSAGGDKAPSTVLAQAATDVAKEAVTVSGEEPAAAEVGVTTSAVAMRKENSFSIMALARTATRKVRRRTRGAEGEWKDESGRTEGEPEEV